MLKAPIIRYLQEVDYQATWEEMMNFTLNRSPETCDEIWICSHPKVFTLGLAGKKENLLKPGLIPIIKTDRGGQVTFHGPGQVVAYPLVDLKRKNIYPKQFVFCLEEALIRTLNDFSIEAFRIAGAPGVYVKKIGGSGSFSGVAKIAAIGLKISNHCTYHGIALNVCMDLSDFLRINPCGYQGLRTTDMKSLGSSAKTSEVATTLANHLQEQI